MIYASCISVSNFGFLNLHCGSKLDFVFKDVKGQHFHYCTKEVVENGFKKIAKNILTIQMPTINVTP